MKSPFKPRKFSRPPVLAKIASSRAMDSVEKGYAFEKFVVSMFDTDNHFDLLEWRSDKRHNGISPRSNEYPDLEIALEIKRKLYHFAVECKWREPLPGSRVEWAEWQHLHNYNDFAEKKKIPVFIVLGYGGEPMNPYELYCVPLKKLPSIITDRGFLLNYQHNIDQKFYFNTSDLSLK